MTFYKVLLWIFHPSSPTLMIPPSPLAFNPLCQDWPQERNEHTDFLLGTLVFVMRKHMKDSHTSQRDSIKDAN